MAFDKNNTSLGMKIVIIVFAVVLVLSLCLPFFSSCSSVVSTGSSTASDTEETTTTSTSSTTVADVKATYSTLISSLEEKLAADPESAAASASLGNAYMDLAMAMRSASDADDAADEIVETFAQAVSCYDTYLETTFSNAVSVDRAVCLFYGGDEDQATADLLAFLDEHDDYPMAWYNLGVFYQTAGDYDAAEEAYTKAMETDPDDAYGAYSYAYSALTWVQYLQSIIVSTDDDGTITLTTVDSDEDADDAEAGADEADDAEAEETDGDDADADA